MLRMYRPGKMPQVQKMPEQLKIKEISPQNPVPEEGRLSWPRILTLVYFNQETLALGSLKVGEGWCFGAVSFGLTKFPVYAVDESNERGSC